MLQPVAKRQVNIAMGRFVLTKRLAIYWFAFTGICWPPAVMEEMPARGMTASAIATLSSMGRADMVSMAMISIAPSFRMILTIQMDSRKTMNLFLLLMPGK